MTIRNLDAEVKRQLRLRAAGNGRSMEEEARVILRQALTPGGAAGLAQAIQARFAALGGVDLMVPSREAGRAPPVFE